MEIPPIPNVASLQEIRFGEPLKIQPGNEIAIPFLNKKGFRRSVGWHHGIFIENNIIIHNYSTTYPSIQKVNFADFMKINDINHSVYVFEYPDDSEAQRQATIKIANILLNSEVNQTSTMYDDVLYNSQSFTTQCRTGFARSGAANYPFIDLYKIAHKQLLFLINNFPYY